MNLTGKALPEKRPRRLETVAPLRNVILIVAAYFVTASLWVATSDYLIAAMIPEASRAFSLGTVKAFFFILITSALLAMLLSWHEQRNAAARQELERLLRSLEAEVDARTRELRRLLEERAADADSRYRALFENHHTVLLLLDPQQGIVIDANPAASEFYGIPLEELKGCPWSRFDPTPPEQLRRALNRAILREREGLRFRHRVANGELREVELFSAPFHSQGRHLIFALVLDVTERVRAENLLHLRTRALDAAANIVTITDAVGTILWVNRAFETVTGYTAEEAVGKNPRDLLKSGLHDDAFYRRMWEMITAGEPWSGEITNRKKDGSLYTASMTITPVRDPTQTITHFIAVNEDITERKEIETRFLRAQRLENIGKLAGGIAHDINNILAPILLSIGLLKTEKLEPRQLAILDTIETSATRGTDLVRQILSFARGVEGKRLAINLRHLARDVERILRETFPKNITIELASPSDLPLVEADPTQLHQVLMNLCVNARDAMPSGGTLTITLGRTSVDQATAAAAPGATPGDYLLISVRDTGSGMTKEILDHIFDPFFTTKEPGHGTGLGLSTSHTIVKNHGGFIAVQTAPGRGSTFRVYLPVIPNPATVSAPEEQTLPQKHRLQAVVLVVDDEPPILDTARLALSRFGARVLTATNGAEAVEIYTQHRDEVDLVLLDLAMPVMDGHATLLALRAIAPTLPIIATSGHASGRNAPAQADAFIAKPFTAEALLTQIEQVLSQPRKRTGQSSRQSSSTPASSPLARSAPPESAVQ